MKLSQEEIASIMKRAEKGLKKLKVSGGQSTGAIDSTVYIKSEETDFYIEVGVHRSQLRNMKLAFDLFELYLGEI